MSLIEPEFMDLTAQLDVPAFWTENALCERFTTDKPRCSLSFSPDDHWLFEFLGVSSTLRYFSDKPYRDSLHRKSNRITREYVGRAFFEEDTWQYNPKRIENLFGSEFSYTESGTPWLTTITDDPHEFARVLDRAEQTNIAEWALPVEYRQEWDARQLRGYSMPLLGTGSRGPATIMTAVVHPETLFFWFYDHPTLMQRFREILGEKMVEFNTVLRQFSGNTQPGWWITDDNCALFNKKLYREYCQPVLQKVLSAMAPGDARRYQHSDSAMGHLLDYQRELGINSVNYGPTVDAGLIREKMPEAVINGELPPMLARDGSPDEIKARIVSDFEKAGASGGLNITTAGSLAAGTGVGRMRWQMQVVQDCCRYS